ncbi:MAG: tetratricopeptide repeat protein [Ktedonobacterales bacterium]
MSQATNLPKWFPPLIGREQAIAEGVAELTHTRLLTLIGPGGTGKTCLAIAIANRLLLETHAARMPYGDGLWGIDLTLVTDPELVPHILLTELGVPDSCYSSTSLTDAVLAFLRDKHLLLLLDNCEHLLPACTRWIELLLQSCPHLVILATSREALRSSYEQIWPVGPLSIPDSAASPTLEQAREYTAIQLFVRRASLALPTFEMDTHNALAVIQICRCLDGLPLAIELAAACVSFLSPQQIAQQLKQGFAVLAQGYRTAAARQQTLEATMAWSYQLLQPCEQRLFRALSVVADTFDAELAQALDGQIGESSHANLRALIDKSLVTVVKRDRSTRYRILEMLRHYGRAQLMRCGEEAKTYQRYSAWVAKLTADALASLESGKQACWFDRLETELGHIRAALRWMLDHDEIEPALTVSTSLLAFWRQRGHMREGQRWLESAVAAYSSHDADRSHTGTTVMYAEALNALGVLQMWQGHYSKSQALHEQALLIWRQLDNRRGMAATWFRLGFLADRHGNFTMATAHFERSERLFAEEGDGQGAAMVRSRLGITAWNKRQYRKANALLQESLRVQQGYGHLGGCAATLLNLGALATEQGDFVKGTAYLEESLALNRQLRDHLATAYSLVYLGRAAIDGQKAVHWHQEALTVVEALDPEGRLVDPELQFRLVDGIGVTVARCGLVLPAAQLWGSMDCLRTTYGLSYRTLERRTYELEVAAARARVGSQAFQEAWSEGRCMPHTALVASAFSALAAVQPSKSLKPLESSGIVAVPAAGEKAETALLRISGLGPAQIYVGEKLITTRDLIYTKAQELLFYLLAYPRPTKAQIALALWPDATDEHVRTTFRVILYHLRRALGGPEWIEREQQSYVFNRRLNYWYDAESFATLVQVAIEHRSQNPEQAIASLEAARKLYRGDFGEGLALSDWMIEQQESLRRLHLEALLALGGLYLSTRQPRRALAAYLDAAGCEKYCESAYRGAIRCYLVLQEPAAAKIQYLRLCQYLRQELGTHPSAQTKSLVESLL